MRTKNIALALLFTITLVIANAQAPSRFNYQAVARDNEGNPLSKKLISIRAAIVNLSPNGTEIYKETFLISTNEFGHFNLAIGGGNVISGSMNTILWDQEDKYLKIEMDVNGGSNYVLMGTSQLLSVPYALNAKTTSSLSNTAKINLDQINGNGAVFGQLLVWNGTKWQPTSTSNLPGDDWGTQIVQTSTLLSGNGTSANKLTIAQQGASTGQVLQWNGTTWIPATISSGGSDNWGTQTAVSSGIISGNGTTGNPLLLSQQGATNGQVLKWNGTTWSPANETGSDNWGAQSAAVNSTLTGNGTSANPLGIAPQGATTGQVLRWNGTDWVPATLSGSGTGDDWGIQSVVNNGSLVGTGTIANKLGVDSIWLAKKINQAPIKDSIISLINVTPSPFSANNGLSKSANNISLGGTLTTPTSLSTSSTNTLAVSGLQNGSTIDSIVVADATSGVLKRISPSRISGTTYTSNNGLTLTGSNFALGGALATPTAITTTGTNTLAVSGLQSGSISSDSLLVANATTGVLKRISSARLTGTTYTSNNGITLAGSNFALGGALAAPTAITTTGTNTLAVSGLQSGSISDSLLVADAVTGVVKRVSSARISTGGSGTVTASNGLTATGSNVTLGGTLSGGSTVINTTQLNNLALIGLWTGYDDDSVLTSNAINGVINRQHRNRINHWSKSTLNNLYYKNGVVSIGTDTASKNLYVYRNGGATVDTSSIFRALSTGAGHPVAIVANATNSAFNSAGIGIRAQGGYAGIFSNGIGLVNGTGAYHYGVIGRASNNSLGNLYGVYGESDSGNFSVGVRGIGSNVGVLGNVIVSNTKNNILGYGFGDTLKSSVVGATTGINSSFPVANIGTLGLANSTNTWANIGINGIAKAPSGTGSNFSIGVLGEAQGGTDFQIGVMGWVDSINSGSSVYAGYFNSNTRVEGILMVDDTIIANKGLLVTGGKSTFNDSVRINSNLFVNGTLSKAAGTFRIDHPQDPENKYLVHSFVESPDMMNVYNGNSTTDKGGFVVVTLPEYFESLNMDFRYQLTVIGTFAQAIIKEKIKNNSFVIQTDKPNIEVSWQVTGIRKDPYAMKNRIIDVEEKSVDEKGLYLHPELYGKPSTQAIGKVSTIELPKVQRLKNGMTPEAGEITKELYELPKLDTSPGQ